MKFFGPVRRVILTAPVRPASKVASPLSTFDGNREGWPDKFCLRTAESSTVSPPIGLLGSAGHFSMATRTGLSTIRLAASSAAAPSRSTNSVEHDPELLDRGVAKSMSQLEFHSAAFRQSSLFRTRSPNSVSCRCVRHRSFRNVLSPAQVAGGRGWPCPRPTRRGLLLILPTVRRAVRRWAVPTRPRARHESERMRIGAAIDLEKPPAATDPPCSDRRWSSRMAKSGSLTPAGTVARMSRRPEESSPVRGPVTRANAETVSPRRSGRAVFGRTGSDSHLRRGRSCSVNDGNCTALDDEQHFLHILLLPRTPATRRESASPQAELGGTTRRIGVAGIVVPPTVNMGRLVGKGAS